jgi:hypothetical protein
MRIGELHDGDDETKARLRAWELDLEDRALEKFPEIWELGTFGDPAFEEALDRAVDLVDGEAEDGSDSTAAIELRMDLEELEMGYTDADDDPGDEDM